MLLFLLNHVVILVKPCCYSCLTMLLLLLNYIVLRALWKIDVYLISTLVNKSLYYYYLLLPIGLIATVVYEDWIFKIYDLCQISKSRTCLYR